MAPAPLTVIITVLRSLGLQSLFVEADPRLAAVRRRIIIT